MAALKSSDTVKIGVLSVFVEEFYQYLTKFGGAIYGVPNFTVFLPVFNCDFQ